MERGRGKAWDSWAQASETPWLEVRRESSQLRLSEGGGNKLVPFIRRAWVYTSNAQVLLVLRELGHWIDHPVGRCLFCAESSSSLPVDNCVFQGVCIYFRVRGSYTIWTWSRQITQDPCASRCCNFSYRLVFSQVLLWEWAETQDLALIGKNILQRTNVVCLDTHFSSLESARFRSPWVFKKTIYFLFFFFGGSLGLCGFRNKTWSRFWN